MGSQLKEDCPFCADNARKRREEMDRASVTKTHEGPVEWRSLDGSDTKGG